MKQYKIALSEYGRENLEETIATLMEAAEEIANSSQSDFEKMQSQKWYTRLWKLITYSRDNQKIAAHGVSNLAKLNEIVMKTIVIVARYSADTADLVSQSLEKIDGIEDYLGEMTEGMKKLAFEIKAIKNNYKKSLGINDLKEAERDIFGSLFYKYVNICDKNGVEGNSASQSLYAYAMYNDIPEDDIDIETHLEKLGNDVQQLLFRYEQSYYYLITGEFDYSDYFDDFNISPKARKNIFRSVEDAVKFAGAERYTKMLGIDDDFDLIEQDGIDFDTDNNENTDKVFTTKFDETVADKFFFDDKNYDEYFKYVSSFDYAECKDTDVLSSLGYCYKHGLGVKSDIKKSLEYYEKAFAIKRYVYFHEVEMLRAYFAEPSELCRKEKYIFDISFVNSGVMEIWFNSMFSSGEELFVTEGTFLELEYTNPKYNANDINQPYFITRRIKVIEVMSDEEDMGFRRIKFLYDGDIDGEEGNLGYLYTLGVNVVDDVISIFEEKCSKRQNKYCDVPEKVSKKFNSAIGLFENGLYSDAKKILNDIKYEHYSSVCYFLAKINEAENEREEFKHNLECGALVDGDILSLALYATTFTDENECRDLLDYAVARLKKYAESQMEVQKNSDKTILPYIYYELYRLSSEPKEYIKYLSLSAEAGNVMAMNDLAVFCFYYIDNITPYYEIKDNITYKQKAISLWEKAFEKKYAPAAYNLYILGKIKRSSLITKNCYPALNIIGVKIAENCEGYKEALSYFEKAENMNNKSFSYFETKFSPKMIGGDRYSFNSSTLTVAGRFAYQKREYAYQEYCWSY